jgi:hypothetical protein
MIDPVANEKPDESLTFDYLDTKARDRKEIEIQRQIYLENGGLITRRESDGTVHKYGLLGGKLQKVTI